MLRRLSLPLLLLGSLLAPGVWAQSATTHVVQPGDNFSSIAERYLGNASLWREVWHANPQVAEPARLTVGEVLNIPAPGSVTSPRPVRRGGRLPVVKLSPQVISTPIEPQVYTIPRDAIAPFLELPRVLESGETDALFSGPYVLGNEGRRIVTGAGDKIFVHGLQVLLESTL